METMSLREAAKLVGCNPKSLQRLDREGKLKPVARTKTNRRVYARKDLVEFFGLQEETGDTVLVYARVSSPNQRKDLENQVKVLQDFCKSKKIKPDEVLTEIGGGLNFKRRRFNDILSMVEKRQVKTLVIAHKDRFVRFGFEWFKSFCENHGCEVLVIDDQKLSPETEMVNDLMTIIHCFSSRLYGLRNYRKSLRGKLRGKKP